MKKSVLIVFVLCTCLIIIVLCVAITSQDYGCEATFYSHNGEYVYFDGRGNCINGDINCTYYIKGNHYYIKHENITRKMTLVDEGVLVDFSKSGLAIDTGVRSGSFEAKFKIGGYKYTVCKDGTFGIDYGNSVLKLGEYSFNDGVLVFRFTKNSSYRSQIRVFYL